MKKRYNDITKAIIMNGYLLFAKKLIASKIPK